VYLFKSERMKLNE